MPFPTSPVAGVTTYTTSSGVTYLYDSKGAWSLVGGSGGGGSSGLTSVTATAPLSGAGTAASPLVIAQSTEAQRGTAEIITQAEADAATAASGNDTDIVTMKKLLNIADPGKANLRNAIGAGGTTYSGGQFGVGSTVLASQNRMAGNNPPWWGSTARNPGDIVATGGTVRSYSGADHLLNYGSWMLVGNTEFVEYDSGSDGYYRALLLYRVA